ncbi:hypothetical protein ACK1ML_004646, partial [Salmonella enterica]
AFDFIPRNYLNEVDINEQYEDHKEEASSSLWPVLKIDKNSPDKVNKAAKEMPFSANFWEEYKRKMKGNPDSLKEIKGYITLLPIHWTEDENNLVDYHVELID